MWEYEHVETTEVPAEAIWRAWADVPGWREWNPDVTAAEVDGAFEAGSMISMSLGSGDVVPLRLVDVVPGERFVDEATLDGITVRTVHRVERQPGGGSRVGYATQVTGEVPAEVLAEVGGAITADFPQTVAALLAHCASGSATGSVTGSA